MGGAGRDHGHGLQACATFRRRDTTPRRAHALNPIILRPAPATAPLPGWPALGASATLSAPRADGAGAIAATGVSRVRRIPPWPGPARLAPEMPAGPAVDGSLGRAGPEGAVAGGARVPCRARGAGKARRGALPRSPHRPLRLARRQQGRHCKARAVPRRWPCWKWWSGAGGACGPGPERHGRLTGGPGRAGLVTAGPAGPGARCRARRRSGGRSVRMRAADRHGARRGWAGVRAWAEAPRPSEAGALRLCAAARGFRPLRPVL
jgi:hypothetical protein